MELFLALLAANVGLMYFTVAALVIPRIQIGNVTTVFGWIFRIGAITLFVGLGLSHLHLAIHAFDEGAPAAFHQVWMHMMQIVGGWAFVFAAMRMIDIRVENHHPRFAALEDLAQRDPLTGAFNRRALGRLIGSHAGSTLSIVAIDLDNFKETNDTHGHPIGDRVLCGFVDAATNALRASDSIVRVGGDEFVVVLPGVDADVAQRLVDRLHRAVDDVELPAGAEIRFSSGIATCPTDTDDPSRLVAHADAAMYEHKRRRRSGLRRST